MCTINIGIGHDDDLVITKLADIKILMDSRSKCCDHSFDLGICINFIQTCFLYVQDLTSQRQDSLCHTVSGSLCGTTGGISLYDVDLAVLRILV